MKFKGKNRNVNGDPTNYNLADRGARRSRRLAAWLWAIFLTLGCTIFLLLLLIYNGVIGYMPPIEELEDPHNKLASVVYASDGTTELGRYYKGSGNRLNTNYEDISEDVINALIATEDVRFDDHSGIDFKALGRSGVKTIIMRDKSQGGGSTITQQLAKQLYSQPAGDLFKRALQKPIEWMIALKLERFYTKKEILSMYLNRFDFLNNAVGIKSAANIYFNKEPQDLNIQEAATLVGMLKNPSYYNPKRYPERTRERRNVVFDQMVKNGSLSQADADSLKDLPLELTYTRVNFQEGGSPYLREEIRRLMTAKKPEMPKRKNYKDDVNWNIAYGNYKTDSTEWENNQLYGWLEKNRKPNGDKYDLYTDGLRIYTTIDMKMQQYAEEAVYQHLGGVLQPAFFREKSGPMGAYSSPGVPKETAKKLFNQAIRKTERWRTMKEAGISEKDIMKAFDEKYEMDIFYYTHEGGKWKPSTKTVKMSPKDSLMYMKKILRTSLMSMDPVTGYVKAYVGGADYEWFQYDMAGHGKRQIGSTMKPFLYTLALEDTSSYTPCTTVSNARVNYGGWTPKGGGGGGALTLKAALTASNNTIAARLIHDLGPVQLVKKLRMFGISGYAEPTYPLCLGPNDVSMKEMVGAYSAFPNEGLRVDPVYVTRIEDNQGNVIYNAVPHHEEVTDPETAYKMIGMLESVIAGGTGRGVRHYIHGPVGGKTGTTNSNADAWFMGFTPELVTGVWVGGEERTIRFNTTAMGQGAKAALPIWGLFNQKVYSDPDLPYSSDTKFNIPDDFSPCGDKPRSSSGGGKSSGGGGGSAKAKSGGGSQATTTRTETVEGIFD